MLKECGKSRLILMIADLNDTPCPMGITYVLSSRHTIPVYFSIAAFCHSIGEARVKYTGLASLGFAGQHDCYTHARASWITRREKLLPA